MSLRLLKEEDTGTERGFCNRCGVVYQNCRLGMPCIRTVKSLSDTDMKCSGTVMSLDIAVPENVLTTRACVGHEMRCTDKEFYEHLGVCPARMAMMRKLESHILPDPNIIESLEGKEAQDRQIFKEAVREIVTRELTRKRTSAKRYFIKCYICLFSTIMTAFVVSLIETGHSIVNIFWLLVSHSGVIYLYVKARQERRKEEIDDYFSHTSESVVPRPTAYKSIIPEDARVEK